MNRSLARSLFIAGSLLAGAAFGAESAPAPAAGPKAAPPTTPPPAEAAPAKNETPGVKGMARDFGQQRKDRLAAHQALLARLNSAKTEEEKRKIIAEIRQQQQQRMEQQRELARNIREQMQATRQRDTGIIATGK